MSYTGLKASLSKPVNRSAKNKKFLKFYVDFMEGFGWSQDSVELGYA